MSLVNELKIYHTGKQRRVTFHLPKFVFLCGKDRTLKIGNNRAAVEKYFKKYRSDIFCIYAEDLFADKMVDLLTFELFLTEMSDYIILFVESEGSACELGAFAMNQNIYEKMIVFRDISKKDTNSFINDGPLKRIPTAQIVYADLSLNTALSLNDCDKALRNLTLYRTCRINSNENHVNVRTFMLELLELIRVIGPVAQEDLLDIYKFVKGFTGFRFVSETDNASTPSRLNINIKYIIDMLASSGAISYKNRLATLNNGVKVSNIMFDLSETKLCSLRTKFLAKKYKYERAMDA